jgi:hypothetical protein
MKATEKIEASIKAGAEKLSRSLNQMPVRAQRRWLIVTGCVMAALCLFMVITPFTKQDTIVVVVPEGRISTQLVPPAEDHLLTPADLMMLRDFKQVMDSLKIYDLSTYDEILQGRHGLLDSVELLLRWNQ